MRYFGGKNRSRKIVVSAMKPWLDVAPMYVEPFVGGLSIARTVRESYPRLPMVLSDLGTVAPLYQACLAIYESEGVGGLDRYLPKVATEDIYRAVRPEDPLWAFYRIGCAFSGKEKDGFARGNQDYCQNARNSLLRDIPLLASGPLAICHGSYESLPYESLPPRTVAYCDPPYEARGGYYTNRGRPFDHGAFESWLKGSRRDLAIFVSEGPHSRLSDVWPYVSWERSKGGMRGKNKREERLFYPPWLGVP